MQNLIKQIVFKYLYSIKSYRKKQLGHSDGASLYLLPRVLFHPLHGRRSIIGMMHYPSILGDANPNNATAYMDEKYLSLKE